MKLIKLTLFVLFFSAMSGFGQADKCNKSTEGKDFWFGFMESRHHQAPLGHQTEITITSIYTCNYEIFIGKTFYTRGTIYPNFPLQIPIDWQQVEVIGSENIERKAIHLISDQPLNVYALNWSNASSDVALIFPTESLGNEYYAICYTPNYVVASGSNLNAKNSEFLIVASANETHISITPSVVTDGGKPSEIPYSIILNEGELYQVQSANLPNLAGQGDLTGSQITSDHPIAVFSGSYSTSIPYGVCCYDHLYEQIPPVQTWGRKFIAVPLKDRKQDYYRVLASVNGTTVKIGSKPQVSLNAGDYYEFILTSTEPSLIESTNPVLLAQYSASNDVDRPPGVNQNDWDGDPFMVIVSPVNQTREKVAFVAYASARIKDKYYINVVVKDDAKECINLVTGSVVTPIIFTQLSGTGYSYAQVKIAQGNHIIESTVTGKGFIAYVYGFGGVESYGYGVGYNLDIVLDLGSNINANGDKLLVRCDGAEPLTLNAGNAFDTYLWNTGATTSSIQVTNDGWYKVSVSTKEGCELKDSVELQVNKPIINMSSDTTICNSATVVLDAGDQFISYLWTTPQTSLTDQKITVSKPGKYAVVAINKYGCKARDSIMVVFGNKPKLDFSRLDTLICGKKTAVLDVTSDKGSFTVQRLSDGFVFKGLEVAVPNFGTYQLKIKTTDEFSCYSDSVVRFGFRKTPIVDFSVDSSKCYGYNLDVKYLGDATVNASDFIWVFGGDTIKRGIGVDSYIVPLGINRATRDLKLMVTYQGCSNEKTLRDIKVIPNLQMRVDDSIGCEPFTAKFVANNTETVTYAWDFGDGNVLSGSTANPSHTYQNDGYYLVKLKVTTNKGCTNEVRIDNMVTVTPIPTIGFTPLPAACLEKGNHQISYLGTGDHLDTYIWDLSKFDKEEVIQNPDTTQGPLVFNLKNKPQANIGLKVISKFGCRSDEANVLVKRIPDFSINSSSSAGCIPFEPIFTVKTGDPVDQVNYSWDFGDGTNGSGDQVKHEYGEPDHKYDVILTALSSTTGCADTLSSEAFVWAYPKPKAAFNMDNPIVYNDKPTVNFSNSSIGASEYLWNFGDGSTSDLKDPSHYYKVTGYRTVLLEVLNEFLCSDTVSHQLRVAFDRIFPPNAFSPNAPNMVDREFRLGSDGFVTEGYHLTILSRWNDIVFEVRDEIKGWNGQTTDGNFVPAGTYVWILDFRDLLGRRHRQTGTVTVVY